MGKSAKLGMRRFAVQTRKLNARQSMRSNVLKVQKDSAVQSTVRNVPRSMKIIATLFRISNVGMSHVKSVAPAMKRSVGLRTNKSAQLYLSVKLYMITSVAQVIELSVRMKDMVVRAKERAEERGLYLVDLLLVVYLHLQVACPLVLLLEQLQPVLELLVLLVVLEQVLQLLPKS